MSKAAHAKSSPEASRYDPSVFTITFAIEIIGLDLWHDCNEGWLDLGPSVQGIKLQYQLYPGHNFDIDVVIWPHVVKVWCGVNNSWVRTWQFLDRRFLTFSIEHIFPVRVMEFRNFVATLVPNNGLGSLGSNARNDKVAEVFLPPLEFGQKRYFGDVIEKEISGTEFVIELIYNVINKFIPASILDTESDTPHVVTDIRHQDAIIYYVKETILSKIDEKNKDSDADESKGRNITKTIKEKEKEVKKPLDASKHKFELRLSGDSILAGIGRIVPFEKCGDLPHEVGEVIAIISSTNLPANDDLPLIFVNIETLYDAPFDYFNKLRISHLYTRWVMGGETHDSETQLIKSNATLINFNDHHALPVEPDSMSEITSMCLEMPFEVQLRGIRSPSADIDSSIFFGYKKGDQNFGTASCVLEKEDKDTIIAVTKIDARSMCKGVNKFIKEDFPLYPPTTAVVDLNRKELCTNDINLMRAPKHPVSVVSSHVVLQAQMTLCTSLGLVGCQPKKSPHSYARLFCFVNDTESVMTMLKQITEINDKISQLNVKDGFLTGFAIDIGNTVIIYLEGRSDGPILRVWEKTEDFHSSIKAVYSSSQRYTLRMYPDMLMFVPFTVLKMYVPLSLILACPSVYAIPSLPLPTKSALLKLGRLVARKLQKIPTRLELPSSTELSSFRLELCVAPKPATITPPQENKNKTESYHSNTCVLQKINWQQENDQQ